jgi:aldose 1-epimerase
VAVVYAPKGKNFICFEPMSALTNGFNLAHDGLWDGLQSVPAGGEWRGTFEIRPTGFQN